jgi:putative hydrolase of the HAD superfamily
MAATVRAVTFDYWNTLCRARPAAALARRKAAWRQVAVARGLPVVGEVLDTVLDHVTALHHEGWTAGVQFTMDHALEAAGELLAEVLGPGDLDALRRAWIDASDRADVSLTPHCATVLAELRRRGIRIGIVCDVGLTPSVLLRGFLEHHGVLAYFDHWSFSDEVGVYKPDEAIFRHALAGLGAAPHEALHIGDIRRTDIAGARAAGMHVVRYRGIADDDDDAVADAPTVLDDLRDLVAALDQLV